MTSWLPIILITVSGWSMCLRAQGAEASDEEPLPGWYADLGASVFLRGELIRFVEKTPFPVSLGLSTRPEEDKHLGHWTRFTFFRRSDGDRIGEYYFLGYGLSYLHRSTQTALFGGYELMLVLLKERLSSTETAITLHDLYLSPTLGAKTSILERKWFQLFFVAAFSFPKHSLTELFLKLGLEVSLKL